MMYTEIAIGSIILVAVIIAILFFMSQKKDTFDISVDPLKPYSPYKYISNENCPKRAEVIADNVETNGLNPEINTDASLKSYLDEYEQANDFSNPDTARLVAMRYCDLKYMNHRRWYTNRWSASGECQIEIKRRIEDMFPNTPKKPLIYQ